MTKRYEKINLTPDVQILYDKMMDEFPDLKVKIDEANIKTENTPHIYYEKYKQKRKNK